MPARDATAGMPVGDSGESRIIADIVAQQVAASYVAVLAGLAQARLDAGSPIGKAAAPVTQADGRIPDRKRTEAVRNERRNAGGQWTATGGGTAAKPDGDQAGQRGESPVPGDADASPKEPPVPGDADASPKEPPVPGDADASPKEPPVPDGSPKADASGQAATGVFDGAGQDFRMRAKALMDQDLNRADLSGAMVSDMDLSGESLRGANFSNAIMLRTNLASADLTDANLSGALLGNANLRSANLEYANLTGGRLFRANLSGASLISANLTGADLTQANLRGANLTQADLGGADLTDTDLLGAVMDGTNFEQAYTLDAMGRRRPFMPARAPTPPVAAVAPVAPVAPMAEHAWPETPGVNDLLRDHPYQSLGDVTPERFSTTVGDAWSPREGLGLRDGVRPIAPGRSIVQHVGPASGIRTVAFRVGDADDERRAPFAITQWTRDGAELGVYRSYPQESLAPPGAPGSGPHPVDDPAETAPTYDDAYRRSMQLAAWAEAQFEQARTPDVQSVGGKPPKGHARALAARDSTTLDLYSSQGGSGPPTIEFEAPYASAASRRPFEMAFFNRALRPAEYGEMVGAIHGATVTVSYSGHRLLIETEHEFYRNSRRLVREDGDAVNTSLGGPHGTDTPDFGEDESVLVCNNDFFRATDEAPPGLASRVLGTQVRKLMKLGAGMIRVHGVGDRHSNQRDHQLDDDGSRWMDQTDWSGYTVWPKLGFQAAFTEDLRQMCEDRRTGGSREPERHATGPYDHLSGPVSRDEDGNAIEDDADTPRDDSYDDWDDDDAVSEDGYSDVDPPDGLAQITDFNTLHATEQGRAYWEEYGEEGWWHFDLRKLSRQRKVLDAYLKRKRINLGPELP